MESRFNQPLADSVSSLSFYQASSLLQINFTSQRFFAFPLSNLYLQFLFRLVPYQQLFEVNFLHPFLISVRTKSRCRTLPKRATHRSYKSLFNYASTPQTNPLNHPSIQKQSFLHKPFLQFRKLFYQPRIPLFNPTIRVRRRKYALFQEKTTWVKNVKVNLPRRRWNRQTLKVQSRRFSKVKRLWFKVVLRRFNSWKKMRFLKRREKSSKGRSLTGNEVHHHVSKFLRQTLNQAPLLSPLRLSTQVNPTDCRKLQLPNPLLMRQLTSTFSRFILSWLFHRRSKVSFVHRSNLTPSFKKTHRLKYPTASTSFQGVVDSFDKPVQRRSLKVSQNLYLSTAPSTPIASKTLFIFRRYLTRLLQDSIPTSSSRTFRTLRKRGFIRRKRTRLPRALHFMKPYRSKAASFRSSSTFRYLFRRVLLLRRRKFFRKKSLTRLRKIGRSGTSSHRFLMSKYPIRSLRRASVVVKPTVWSTSHLKQKLVQKRIPFISTLFWSPKNSFNVYEIYSSKRLRSKKIRKARHRRATLKTLFQPIPNLNIYKRNTFNQLVKKTLTKKTPFFKVKRCYVPQLTYKYRTYIRIRLEHLKRAYKRLRYRRRSRRFFHRENAPFVRNGKRYLKLRTFHSRQEGVQLLKNIFKKPQLMEKQSLAWSLSTIPSSMSDAGYNLKLTRGAHLAKSSVWFKSTLRKGTTLRPTTLNHRRCLAFESLRNLPFILSATGFLYNPGFVKQISLKSTAYIRCTKYSFFDALRIKRFILKERTGRAFFAKRKIKRTITNIVPYTHRLDKTNLRRTLRDYDNEETPYYGDFLSMNPSWTLSQPWKRSPGSIRNEYNLRIRRIRFKPGYSRIWRKARTALMQVLDLNFRYQHRLTVYLGRFAHIASRVHKKLLDIRVHTLLIRSRFVFDLTTANNLVTSRLVFVNGRLVLNPRMFLFVGDVLQLIVHLKFYIVYRWLLNWYTFKTHRRARLARSKFKKVSHAQTKQRSSRLPDWLFKARSVNRDIPKFLEVDFFTLSSFIVYTPFSKNDLETLDILDSRLEVYNMYNWKYIN